LDKARLLRNEANRPYKARKDRISFSGFSK